MTHDPVSLLLLSRSDANIYIPRDPKPSLILPVARVCKQRLCITLPPFFHLGSVCKKSHEPDGDECYSSTIDSARIAGAVANVVFFSQYIQTTKNLEP